MHRMDRKILPDKCSWLSNCHHAFHCILASSNTKFQQQDDLATPDATDAGAGEFPMSQSFMNLSLEEQEARKEEWRKELAEVT